MFGLHMRPVFSTILAMVLVLAPCDYGSIITAVIGDAPAVAPMDTLLTSVASGMVDFGAVHPDERAGADSLGLTRAQIQAYAAAAKAELFFIDQSKQSKVPVPASLVVFLIGLAGVACRAGGKRRC